MKTAEEIVAELMTDQKLAYEVGQLLIQANPSVETDLVDYAASYDNQELSIESSNLSVLQTAKLIRDHLHYDIQNSLRLARLLQASGAVISQSELDNDANNIVKELSKFLPCKVIANPVRFKVTLSLQNALIAQG